MTIKSFLISISVGLFLIGGYFHIDYIKELNFQKENHPVYDYFIIDKYCSSSYRSGSSVKISFNGNKYYIPVSRDDCPTITDEYFKSKLYYMKGIDKLFYKDYSENRGSFLLCYIFALLIPLVGFIVYRKELNNHYSTM